MIVDCPSCGATYNISDEKVRGRRVRVRCKNCSGPIIVDGEQIDAEDATRVYQPSLEPNTYEDAEESTRVMTLGSGSTNEPAPGAWTVNVSETDQRTMSLEEIVDTYNAGFVTEDAFVWREGMSDWLPLMEVEEIRSAIESGQATHVVKPAAMRAAARRSVVNPPTPVTYAPAAAAPARARLAPAPSNSVEYAAAPKASPEPARVRSDARHGGQDLFGNIAKAGSEQELLRSSSVPLENYRDKPTGARNESSVLFSLNTVRAGVGPTSAPPRGIVAAPPQTAADILGMNMSGGLPGVEVNAALTSAPVVEPPPRPQVMAPPRRDRMDTLPPTAKRRVRPLLVGAVVFLAAAMAAGSAYVLRARIAVNHPAPTPTVELARTGEPAVANTAAPSANAEGPAAATATPPPTGTSAEAAPSPVGAPPAGTAAPAPGPKPAAPGPAPRPGAPRPAPAPAPQKGADKPAPAGKGDQKVVLEEEPSEGAAAAKGAKAAAPNEAPAAPQPDKPPFDMTAAKAALEASAASAASCKAADGPTGKGKVQVTFSPSGHVTSASVVEGAFGGTPVGGCVAKLFRGAHVPPFSGDPVTVAKGFTIPE